MYLDQIQWLLGPKYTEAHVHACGHTHKPTRRTHKHTYIHVLTIIGVPDHSRRNQIFFKENVFCSHLQKEVTKGIR